MATVFLAEDLKHHRQVAIKILHPELSVAIGAERFVQEIEVTAGLQHPHILPLFDSGEADGVLFHVMPFVEGESLRDRLNRDGKLPVADSLAIAGDIASALPAAHAAGDARRSDQRLPGQGAGAGHAGGSRQTIDAHAWVGMHRPK
jgi:serine/threonine-protein kinase